MERAIDICLYGATGFAGRLVARHLFRRCREEGLRLALAGRNEERLHALALELAAEGRGDPRTSADSGGSAGRAEAPVIRLADSQDAERLDALTRESRVLCSTVGPYARHGTPLVRACVRNGSDYVDLTGEIQWIRESIDLFHENAQETGSRIVHAGGFDSLPSDIGVLLAQEILRRREGQPGRRLYLQVDGMSGGFSRGTIDSMLTLVSQAARRKAVRQVLRDPRSLEPGWRPDAAAPGSGAPARRAPWRLPGGLWTIPFFMEAVNGRVVRRSNALAGYPYGEDFDYHEVIPAGRGLRGFLTALFGRLAFGVAAGLIALPPTRALLAATVFPKPGSGPKAALAGEGRFRVSIHRVTEGEGSQDSGAGNSGRERTERLVSIEAERDPGYGATAIMLGEGAILLARSSAAQQAGPADSGRGGPQRGGPAGGVLTPAQAYGREIVPLLEKAGIHIQEVET